MPVENNKRTQTMKNRCGEDGVINLEGKIGSPSLILDIEDPFFFDSIEHGIKSTVEVLIENGFRTYSSCQGHHNPEFSVRNVVVVLEPHEVVFWRAMIAELNIVNEFNSPITYVCVDYKNGLKGLMIMFGSIFQIEEVERKQHCFEEWVPNIRKQYYNKSINNIIDFTDARGHINTFS